MSKRYIKKEEQEINVTALRNIAILVVNKAQTGLIIDSRKKGSVSYRKATKDSKYHTTINHNCCKALFFLFSL